MPPSLQWEIVPSTVQIGSGALPDKTIPSVALALTRPTHGAEALANALRDLPTPVIGRIHDEVLLLDMR
ncbi:MAG TPA: L-seryl-tRNA(Sec) selenium transferase, partial [Gammaproteobacteria bacterium]|nr:L-seryl-tRNA(Sec) selenium transferase [Gammaproteobacteria bacterium]